ncbi:MAG: DUF4160 domain-containing protein [Cyanobacteria bacterium P01_F01_bin.143]
MGKVGGFNLDGLEAFFRSSDHRPPHFHIKKAGEWEIRVYIVTTTKSNLDYSFKFPKNNSKSINSKEQKKIINFVINNRGSLLLDWETQVCVKEKMNNEF